MTSCICLHCPYKTNELLWKWRQSKHLLLQVLPVAAAPSAGHGAFLAVILYLSVQALYLGVHHGGGEGITQFIGIVFQSNCIWLRYQLLHMLSSELHMCSNGFIGWSSTPKRSHNPNIQEIHCIKGINATFLLSQASPGIQNAYLLWKSVVKVQDVSPWLLSDNLPSECSLVGCAAPWREYLGRVHGERDTPKH